MCLTFALSWGGALALLLPKVSPGQAIPTWYGLMAFPVMLLGPVVASIALTSLLEGRPGLGALSASMRRWRIQPRWYLLVLIAPTTLLVVLFSLAMTVSGVFLRDLFVVGFLFGPIAGFAEEIGWSGFALPRMRARYGAYRGSLLLGLIWGVWHLPVIDFLGAATPHGTFLVPSLRASC
jgi:membrane protease YdiL (CAAX protease family)